MRLINGVFVKVHCSSKASCKHPSTRPESQAGGRDIGLRERTAPLFSAAWLENFPESGASPLNSVVAFHERRLDSVVSNRVVLHYLVIASTPSF